MRTTPVYRSTFRAAAAAALLCLSGCGLLTVEMTSTPETVRSGDPVTFDIKLTNTSQCPLEQSVAVLVPFISAAELNAEFGEIPPDAPPEVLAFIEELRQFVEELCTGGQPSIPTPPAQQPAITRPAGLSTTCRRDDGAIVCRISGPVREPGNAMTFSLFGDRLQCEVDDQIVGCEFHVPLPPMGEPSGVTSAAIQNLTCLTTDVIGILGDEFGAACFVGTFPLFEGLGPNEMATGSVTIPANGAGVTRNLIIAISGDAEDAGVCKGGADAGEACDNSDSSECPGSTCGEGICVGGDTPGLGCDVATQMADCPNGGMCHVCADVPATDLLPIDCTTTYISPEGVPVMSPWTLAGLAVILFAAGSFWLQRWRRPG